MKTCGEVMTTPTRVLAPADSVQLAAQIMQDAHVGSVAVIEPEKGNTVIGIVTDRDIAVRVVAKHMDPSKTPVSEAMSSPVVLCGPETPIEDALYLMNRDAVRRLPVIDNNNALVGIVSAADIAALLAKPHEAPLILNAVARGDDN